MDVIFCLIFCVNLMQCVKAYLTVKHTEAFNKCAENGGLASYDNFNTQRKLRLTYEQVKKLTLQDGESAWVMGYADFSTFLSWDGCYEEQNISFNLMRQIPENNIYFCSNYCLQYQTNPKYIGLLGEKCICLTYNEIYIDKKMKPCSDTECQISSVDDMVVFETEKVHVYKIYNKTMLPWKPPLIKLQQCVYATVINNVSFYTTHSCLTSYNETIHGFICVRSMYSRLSNSCKTYHSDKNDIPAACFVEEEISWTGARKKCRDFKGKLISDIQISLRRYAQPDRKYWTGIFRSYAVKPYNEYHYACLAATRINNTLVLDPDDCNVSKRFLCNDNMTDTYVTGSTPNIVRTEMSKPVQTTSTSEKSKSPTETNLSIYIGSCVAILIAVTVAIVLGVHILKKSRIRRLRQNDGKKNENTVTYTEVYTLAYSNDENKNSQSQISENNYDQYNPTPSHFDCACPRDESNEGTEYDKVILQYSDKHGKLENMVCNIYDRTNDVCEAEHYNVVENVGNDRDLFHNYMDGTGTYSKLKTEGEDYGSVKQNTSISVSSSKENKKKTDNTYDTLK